MLGDEQGWNWVQKIILGQYFIFHAFILYEDQLSSNISFWGERIKYSQNQLILKNDLCLN